MSSVLIKIITSTLYDNARPGSLIFVRNGHHLRGKPPGIAKSLEEKLAAKNYKDPAIHYKVDIGLPPPQINKSKLLQERLKILRSRKNDPELERASRKCQLKIDIEKSYNDWLETTGPYHIRRIAEHYGIFEHLFGDAYFNAWVPLNITYGNNDILNPVYYGNVLKPEETKDKPSVNFKSDETSLWTLLLTNPDGHLTNNEKEYIHWFVGNIPSNQLDKAETIIDYLQPFPPKGTGFHRFVYILYKQNKKLDFSAFKKEGKCIDLDERTFSTYEFYRSFQDEITPAGISFFQSDWSPNVKTFFNKILNMKEPIYEYDFPPPYIRKDEWFPLRQPFNLYMDKHRDSKQVNKEFLVRKLKNVHPFKATPPPVPYPNAVFIDSSVPSWLKTEIRKSRMKWGRINDIE
ncbi:39S ribosomal protein L38, mitochondrial [Sitophilus oryzae]|uniref:Large ribosomal subunit protein mL38 n=1 Tax=Sitophilus oryzae TaxID=7048 RepID=A0A6J2XRH5_SITOR|nr:39S ribosomal protein L38, mitochondrial [Sitophilus oryzae]